MPTSSQRFLGSLERAVRHCKQVQTRMKAGSYNIWNRRYGHVRQEFTVGLQASLDLSQAFDTVPWCLLEAALVRAEVPTNQPKRSGYEVGIIYKVPD